MVASQATRLLVEEDRARARAVERTALADAAPREVGAPREVIDVERLVELDSILIKDGSEYSVELRVSPACGRRGERAHSVPIRRGLDGEGVERKRLEATVLQAQRMESVGALASALAHDLNSALAPMLKQPDSRLARKIQPRRTCMNKVPSMARKTSIAAP